MIFFILFGNKLMRRCVDDILKMKYFFDLLYHFSLSFTKPSDINWFKAEKREREREGQRLLIHSVY